MACAFCYNVVCAFFGSPGTQHPKSRQEVLLAIEDSGWLWSSSASQRDAKLKGPVQLTRIASLKSKSVN